MKKVMLLEDKKIKKTSRLKEFSYKLFSNKLAILGLTIIIIILFMCIFAPLFTSYDPTEPDLRSIAEPPSADHLFGTDKIGRDIFTRILYGGRISIFVGMSGAIGGMIIGVFLGGISGYFGGKFDSFVVKLSELVSVIPQLLLVLLLVTITGRSIFNLIAVFVATGWIATFRVVRGRFFSLREESFVQACKVFGIGDLSIVFRHILPNCLGPVIVQVTLNTANFILQEAALSFIGLGVPSGTPTWGNIINAAKEISSITRYPWIWLTSGAAIALFVLGINFFGDGLRDAFDPKRF